MDEIYTKTTECKNSTPPQGLAFDGVIFLPGVKRYERLRQEEISYVKGDKSHVTVQLTNGQKRTVSTHLGQFTRYLDPAWFVRTSRSHVVNLRYVDAVTTRSVMLGETVIPLTEPYRYRFWERLPIVRLKSD